MANNCNEACTSSCESTCSETCAQKCSQTCSNLCDSTCTYVCKSFCTSSCETMCGTGCTSTCMVKCAGTEMSLPNISTFYDRAYVRKVTKITNPSNSGYLIYPGLNGNASVFKVVNGMLMGKLATAIYDRNIHGKIETFNVYPFATEDSEHMEFDERTRPGPQREAEWTYLVHSDELEGSNKKSSAYSILEIQRVIYDALVRSVRNDTEHIEFEDVLYLIYKDPTMHNLYLDIQNWSWNNTDSYYHNLIKKSSDPGISRPDKDNN